MTNPVIGHIKIEINACSHIEDAAQWMEKIAVMTNAPVTAEFNSIELTCYPHSKEEELVEYYWQQRFARDGDTR